MFRRKAFFARGHSMMNCDSFTLYYVPGAGAVNRRTR